MTLQDALDATEGGGTVAVDLDHDAVVRHCQAN